MMEAAFNYHDLNFCYVNFEVLPENLAVAISGARAMGFRGFNLSLPHKTAVIQHLDGLAMSAQLTNAVNCVVSEKGELIGHNTDGIGFVEAVSQRVVLRGKSMFVMGAGGVARAICVSCALAGVAKITIASRVTDQGRSIAQLVEKSSPTEVDTCPWPDLIQVPPETNILVNATPVGLFPHVDQVPRVDLNSISGNTLVADVIANPGRSAFLRLASDRGCGVLDGRDMLVSQAAYSIQLWSDLQPERSVMRLALDNALRG